jgi:hypothetical protein
MRDSSADARRPPAEGSQFPRLVFALQQVFRADRPYTPDERLVLLYLVHRMSFDAPTQRHSCFYGAERIAEDTGLSERTIRRVVERHRNSTHPLIAFSSRGHRKSLLSTLIRNPEAFIAAREQARIATAAEHEARAARKVGQRLKTTIAKLPTRPLLSLPTRRPRPLRADTVAPSVYECSCGAIVVRVGTVVREYSTNAGRAGIEHACRSLGCHAGTLIQASQ